MERNIDLKSVLLLSNAAGSVAFSFLPILFEDRGLSNKEIALIAIPYSLFLIISNTIFGRLADSRGRRPFLLIGLFTSTFGILAYLWPVNFTQFVFVRILHGITLGVYPAAITGIASDRKLKLGNLSSFGSLGWGLGSLFGGLIAGALSIDIAFALAGVVFFITFIIALNRNTGIEEIRIREVQLHRENAYLISLKRNWKEYLLIVLRHGTANSIWVFWALFLKNDLGLSLGQIGVVQITNMGTQYVIMKTFTDKFTPRKMFVLGGILSAISFSSYPFAENFIQMLGTQVILGISWAFFYVGGLRSVEENSRDDDVVATGTGLFNASLSTAQIVGPILALYLYTIAQNYTLSMFVAGIVTISSVLIYAIIIRDQLFR
ncbi:MAG: MFS transporter [Candidatus Heimdallarchaeota archaeon]|nr:MFS transporter [Candidatus Heimdallarchaeota archaeon]